MRRAFILLGLLSLSVSVLAQDPAAPAPRAGEVELKEALKGLAAKGSFEATVAKFTGVGGTVQNEFDGAMLLSWKSPDAYRMQYQGMWGDTLLVIREGRTILSDRLEAGSDAVLRTAETTFAASWQGSGGESMVGPYPLLFTGESAFAIIAPSTGTIEVKSAGAKAKIFSTTGTRYGSLSFQVSQQNGTWNLDWVETRRTFGGGFGGSLVRMETAKVAALPKKPRDFWKATPEKGVGLTDLRESRPN